MSKSGLNDFLVGVIHNEAASSVLAITKKDLSAFAELCENSLKKLSIMSLDHLDSNIAEPNDLCIIFDDTPISKTQVGLIKNMLAQKVLIIKNEKYFQPKTLIKPFYRPKPLHLPHHPLSLLVPQLPLPPGILPNMSLLHPLHALQVSKQVLTFPHRR